MTNSEFQAKVAPRQQRGRRSVLVGVDGSAGGYRALEWAARHAASHRLPLHVVVAHDAPEVSSDPGLTAAEDVLVEARTRCLEPASSRPVTGAIWHGSPAAALLNEAGWAQLLVVGASGRGSRVGTHVGSVPRTVVRHASCPVVVVRGGHDRGWDGDTIVGIDGSDGDDTVLAAAFDAAATRSGRLTITHAWGSSLIGDPITQSSKERQANAVRAQHLVDSAAGRWRGRYPHVNVDTQTFRDGAVHALTELSNGPALLTVGARGRGGFPSLLLGSVARAVVDRASCPVQVVPTSVTLRW